MLQLELNEMTNTKRAHRKVIRYLIKLKGEEQNSLLH